VVGAEISCWRPTLRRVRIPGRLREPRYPETQKPQRDEYLFCISVAPAPPGQISESAEVAVSKSDSRPCARDLGRGGGGRPLVGGAYRLSRSRRIGDARDVSGSPSKADDLLRRNILLLRAKDRDRGEPRGSALSIGVRSGPQIGIQKGPLRPTFRARFWTFLHSLYARARG
jgi:hypothetical protein